MELVVKTKDFHSKWNTIKKLEATIKNLHSKRIYETARFCMNNPKGWETQRSLKHAK